MLIKTNTLKLFAFWAFLLFASPMLPGGISEGRTIEKIDFEAAARKNSQLKYSLRWTFGRKRQKGWYLYASLIGKAIRSKKDENSSEFSRRVYLWQRNKRLAKTGVIDRRTLFSLISFWQSKRIRPIVVAKTSDLLTAPISDFFDPTRDSELLKLERNTYIAYKKMIEAAKRDNVLSAGIAKRDEKMLKIVSSFRSPKYQASLRRRQPGASRAQIAFKSPHFTGRALDIYVGGEPVTTKDFNRALQVKTKAYKWLVKNAEKFGFYPYFYEPWHWEYVPENLKTGAP